MRWHLPAVLGGLLLLRALFYWQIGSAETGLDREAWIWASRRHRFRSNSFRRILLFSIFSFGRMLGIFICGCCCCPCWPGRMPTHRLVKMPLGRVDGWPRWAIKFLPLRSLRWFVVAGKLAVGVAAGPHRRSIAGARIEQSLVIGLGSYLALEISDWVRCWRCTC
jgi:hypothetical protein